ncbi:MAG TPA: hypothetical protein PK490_12180 [Prosthecobacter sp.]|nr:hypothetical protein [Prosthecobacter sp.]HRK15044.1 hypothetical protein [Prosthecobacter sp.]
MPLDDAETVNRISQILFGYREAPESEIFTRLEYLVEREKSINLHDAVKGGKLKIAIEALHEALEGLA